MISPIRMHLEAIKVSVAGRMAYRTDFFLNAAISFLFEFITPLITLLIYKTGSSFPGWNLYEVLMLQGVFLMAKGIASSLFFGIIGNVLSRVRDGSFDLILIKPRSSLHLLIAMEFDIEELSKFAGGLILFIYALFNIKMPGYLEWIQFIVIFIISLTVIFAFALYLSGIVFVWVGCSRVYEIYGSLSSFGFYPRTIFSKGIQTVITAIIPVAMTGFIPAAVLLGKPTEGVWVSLLSSIIFLIFGIIFWNWMLSKYTSAGG